MSISSISAGQGAAIAALISAPGGAPAGTTAPALSLAAASGESGLIANVEAASGGVSAALQALSSTLGSIIDTTA